MTTLQTLILKQKTIRQLDKGHGL